MCTWRWWAQIDKLELLESVAATSSSIDVSWRPPTKNKDRITGYKLMLSSSSGQVSCAAALCACVAEVECLSAVKGGSCHSTWALTVHVGYLCVY
jgi:hypothetical protein